MSVRPAAAAATERRQPGRQHRDLRAVRRRHAGDRDPGLPQQPDRGRLLRRRPVVHRPAERHRDRRRLPVGRVASSASPGAIALNGYDGFLYSIGFLVAWLVALLLVAELLRNTGRFTMADVLSLPDAAAPGPDGGGDLHPGRLVLLPAGADGRRRRPGRAAARHRRHAPARAWSSPSSASLMILYVLVGGMKGTTWVQIIKAVLLITGAGVMTVWVLAQVRLQPLRPARGRGRRQRRRRAARRCSSPGLQYGATARPSSTSSRWRWPWCSAPRPAARADALLHRADRQGGPPLGGLGDLADRHLLPVHPGPRLRRRGARRPGARSSPHPARRTRRRRCWPSSSAATLLLGFISAVAFATILAVVAGLTITASASFAHDVYANVIKKGKVRADDEVRVARITAVVIGIARDRRRHRRQRPEHRVPGGAGVRGRGVGEPADDPLLAVLEAVQHPRRAVEHLRRADLLRSC